MSIIVLFRSVIRRAGRTSRSWSSRTRGASRHVKCTRFPQEPIWPESPDVTSINENQPEKNREDLRGREAVAKIRELVEKAKNCFFCTAPATGDTGGARPMNVRKVDDDANLWFLSAADSCQNRELAADPSVRLYFQGSPHSDF